MQEPFEASLSPYIFFILFTVKRDACSYSVFCDYLDQLQNIL